MISQRAYRLSDFDYDLPQELIAQEPAPERSRSRLLHVAGPRLSDLTFAALPNLLQPGDLLVVNDTRVIRSRLRGRRETGGKVELLLERIVAPDEAWMQLAASHPPKPGGRLLLDGGATAVVLERDGRFFRLRFSVEGCLDDYLERHAEVPLPPYITRSPGPEDVERYQTIYAQERGAVAAPTAGLHFDAAVLEQLRARGVAIAALTLHVGAGTFQPVDEEELSQHRMDAERYAIPEVTASAIAKTRAAGGAVVAVGTTTCARWRRAAAGARRGGRRRRRGDRALRRCRVTAFGSSPTCSRTSTCRARRC